MKKFFLMLTVMFASLVASAQIVGKAFELSAGGGCSVVGAENYPNKFSFSGQWNSINPAVQDFSADEYTRIVVEFAEPLEYYFNTPSKNDPSAGDPTTWSTGSGMNPGATEWTIELASTGDIYGLFIQNTQTKATSFTIANAYAEKVDGTTQKLEFKTGWGASVEVLIPESDPTKMDANLSQQWGGINISNDIIGLRGNKTLRIYANTDLSDAHLQWCIKTVDDDDAWPQIGVDPNNPTYAECVITQELQSIYLQYTASTGTVTHVDIEAITWENEVTMDVPDVEKPVVNTITKVVIGEDLTADEHVQKIYNNQFSNVSGEITVVSPAKVDKDWDTQFWIVMKEPAAANGKVKLTFDAKASSEQVLSFGAHGKPDGNNWKAGGVCDGITLTDEWNTFERVINVQTGWQSFALDLTKASEVTYDFKNIKIEEYSEVTLAMGDAAFSVATAVNEYEGVTITYADNNMADALSEVEGYQWGAVTLAATGAFLFEEGNVDAIATEHHAMGDVNNALTMFTSATLVPGKTYTVIIPAGGLQLMDQSAYDAEWNNIAYWTNEKQLSYTFTASPAWYVSNLVITEAGWATYSAPFAVDLKKNQIEGVTAYIVEGVEGDVLTLTKIEDGIIPAWQPVVLNGVACVAPFSGEEDPDAWPTGLLSTAGYYDMDACVGDYVLQSQNGKTGFYSVEEAGITIPAWKCFILGSDLNAGPGPRVKALYFDAAATAINKLTSADKKAQIFDVNGRQIDKLQKGINIVNGVKILVK